MTGVYLGVNFCILLGITVSLSLLIALHSFLASRALTSWEYFRWMKITYLKVWPKKYGSPFKRKSPLSNMRLMLQPRQSKLAVQWEMPKSLPRLGE